MRRLISSLLMALILAALAGAQTFRGAINGTVTDPTGAFVPGATVKATEKATSVVHTTVTTSEGQFAFQDLPLGEYSVSVSAGGFSAVTFPNVAVSAGSIYTLPVKMQIGKEATTVEVSAASIALDTTTQTQTMTIDSSVVENAPLNGRDYTQLIAVSPGYGGYSVGGFGSLNGTRANQMNWQIDGVDNNDFWHNIPAVNQGGVSGIAGIILPIDSVDEFSSQTQSGAEAGRNAGGTVNLVLKSGTNTLHGSAYYYNRNEFYGASSPFFIPSATVPKSPPLRNQNWGGSVGGPIFKDKTFYFLTFEKQEYIIGLSGTATEPSDAWVNKALDILNNPGQKYGAYAPVAPSTLSQRLIGAKGFWPRNLIGSLPATLNNFFSPIASTGYSYNGVIKLDHNFNEKHRISARFFGGQGNQTAPLGGSPALGTASSNLKDYFEVAPLHVFNYALVLNSVLTPRFTNQVLTGVNYFNQLFHDFNNSFDTKALGLFLSPDATNNGKPILGAPNVVLSGKAGGTPAAVGFEQIGLTPPEGRNDITWHVTDIASYTIGKHQLRFGGEVRQGQVNEFYHRRGTGKFTFDGTQGLWYNALNCDSHRAGSVSAACAGIGSPGTVDAALALADFMAGMVSSSTIAVGDPERFVTVNGFNLYYQDSWQLTPKLNLNLGMRYEYFGPLHSDRKDLANFVPGKGLLIQGKDTDSIFNQDRNNFAPRIGFAYQPTASPDLVVRGGIGIFYDQINMNPFLDFRPPITAAQGLEGNPIGPFPVSTYSRSTYNWQTVQAGGASIFPPVTVCSNPLCVDNPGFNLFGVARDFRAPYFYNYNLQVEKGLGKTSVLQVGYVGSQGRKLNIVTNINQNGIFNTDVHHQYGSILQLNSIGTSNYNALQSSFKIRAWHGLTSQFGYTWAHALDEISQYRAAILDDPTNLKADYGSTDFDTRHLFTAAFSYDIPGSSHGPQILTHGWQVSSVWNFHTGQPYDEVLANAIGLHLIRDPFKGVSHSFSKNLASCSCPGMQWIDPAAYGTGPQNVGRNKFYGPGFGSVDVSVLKNIPILGERLKAQLRADMFNLFNRINMASGVGAVNGDGTVTDTIGDFNGAPGLGPGEPFNMQLAIKIIF